MYVCQASDRGIYLHQLSQGRQIEVIGQSRSADLCDCHCGVTGGGHPLLLTDEELEVKVEEIERNLTVDVTKLSSYVRRKTTAENFSQTAKIYAQLVTGFVFSLVFGFLVSFDFVTIVRCFYRGVTTST